MSTFEVAHDTILYELLMDVSRAEHMICEVCGQPDARPAGERCVIRWFCWPCLLSWWASVPGAWSPTLAHQDA